MVQALEDRDRRRVTCLVEGDTEVGREAPVHDVVGASGQEEERHVGPAVGEEDGVGGGPARVAVASAGGTDERLRGLGEPADVVGPGEADDGIGLDALVAGSWNASGVRAATAARCAPGGVAEEDDGSGLDAALTGGRDAVGEGAQDVLDGHRPGRTVVGDLDPHRHGEDALVGEGRRQRLVADRARRPPRPARDDDDHRGRRHSLRDVRVRLEPGEVLVARPVVRGHRVGRGPARSAPGGARREGGDDEVSGELAEVVTVVTEMADYAMRLAEERRANPGEDLTTSLVQAEVDGERLTSVEIASFFILLSAAGNETTRNAISHGMVALTRYPEEREKWWSDFDGVAGTAVEEIVRWASPVIFMRRNLTQDIEIGGINMKAGDKVSLWYNSANRDEAKFANPWLFDVTRDVNRKLGSGAAAHTSALAQIWRAVRYGFCLKNCTARYPTSSRSRSPQCCTRGSSTASSGYRSRGRRLPKGHGIAAAQCMCPSKPCDVAISR